MAHVECDYKNQEDTKMVNAKTASKRHLHGKRKPSKR